MELYPFQKKALSQIVTRFNGKALVALEMGLGKTPVAIAAMKEYSAYPCVIVCPASLRLNWAAEIQKWSGLSATVIRKGTDEIAGEIIIFSYEAAAKRALEIAMLRPKLVVLDESHYIKNDKAIRTRQLVPVCRAAKYCLLLTGTPILNRPVELWTQLKALNVNFAQDFWHFARRYCKAYKGRFGWDFSGASNVSELNNLLLGSCMVRELKKNVLTDLPDKRRARIIVDAPIKTASSSALAALCEKALRACDFSIGKALERLRKVANSEISSALFKAYSEIGIKKAAQAADIVCDMAKAEPLVVFAHHKAVIAAIAESLKKSKLGYRIIDGDTPLDERQKSVVGFQNGEFPVILCSITAASTGLTLTRATNMIMVELPWSPGVALQAEDRIHRIGQKEAVTIHYLVAPGTLDEAMWKSLNRKASVGHSILDNVAVSEFEGVSDTAAGGYWNVVQSVLEDMVPAERQVELTM